MMAWHFDEVNDDVQLTDHAALTLPDGDWTTAGWIKLDDNDGPSYQYFLSHGGFDATPSLNWYFFEVNDKLMLCSRDDDGTQIQYSSMGAPGTSVIWQHLILQRSGNTITQYINGVADGAVVQAGYDAVNVAGNLFFGSRSDQDPNRRLGGDMAEWAKWDRALNTTERAHLKNGVCPGSIPGLVWWVQMLAGAYEEMIVPLTVTNDGSTAAPHPPIGYVPKHVINAHQRVG